MESTIEQHGNARLVTIHGSIDASTAPEMTSLLERQIEVGHHYLALNLANVDFMSSAGIRCILHTIKLTQQAGGELRLIAVSPNVHKILEMGGLTTLLKIYEDNDTGLDGFSS